MRIKRIRNNNNCNGVLNIPTCWDTIFNTSPIHDCFNPSVNGWELLTNIQVNQNLVLIAPALCAE
ncbi:MAG: hypothetical protein IPG90_10655 [Bacteroidetes bacterium]|nr:hypothetical protein [Bacteroidota bacterium]